MVEGNHRGYGQTVQIHRRFGVMLPKGVWDPFALGERILLRCVIIFRLWIGFATSMARNGSNSVLRPQNGQQYGVARLHDTAREKGNDRCSPPRAVHAGYRAAIAASPFDPISTIAGRRGCRAKFGRTNYDEERRFTTKRAARLVRSQWRAPSSRPSPNPHRNDTSIIALLPGS
jgi:hypothetical protein